MEWVEEETSRARVGVARAELRELTPIVMD